MILVFSRHAVELPTGVAHMEMVGGVGKRLHDGVETRGTDSSDCTLRGSTDSRGDHVT
jgi:hypothetical protein